MLAINLQKKKKTFAAKVIVKATNMYTGGVLAG